ncbi:unnamed protein product, partial [Prorocentrum cordatum]
MKAKTHPPLSATVAKVNRGQAEKKKGGGEQEEKRRRRWVTSWVPRRPATLARGPSGSRYSGAAATTTTTKRCGPQARGDPPQLAHSGQLQLAQCFAGGGGREPGAAHRP